MSLYLKERIEEQKEDPAKDKIIFTFPWIIALPPPVDEDGDMNVGKSFVTMFGVEAAPWCIMFRADKILIHKNYDFVDGSDRVWNGSCFISYDLFYDNDMRYLYHSSLRTKMLNLQDQDAFETPDGYMTKILDAITKNIARKMVIFVELHLPSKFFYRPFEKPTSGLCGTFCEEYPEAYLIKRQHAVAAC